MLELRQDPITRNGVMINPQRGPIAKTHGRNPEALATAELRIGVAEE